MKRIAFFAALTVGFVGYAARCGAADPAERDDFGWAEIRLNDDPSESRSASDRSTQSEAKRMIQQRAAYRRDQRVARIEANAWMGVDPLRPVWPANPSSASYYQPYTIVVPVFVQSPWYR